MPGPRPTVERKSCAACRPVSLAPRSPGPLAWQTKTDGRLIRHARYFVLHLAKGYLTQSLFRQIVRRIDRKSRVIEYAGGCTKAATRDIPADGGDVRALVKTQKGPGFLDLRDIPRPTLDRHDVLVRVEYCGICGSDLHFWKDEAPYFPPVVLGHEFAGTIVEVGADVRAWRPGDQVVAEPHQRFCGTCGYCRTGNIQMCPDRRAVGWGVDGALAEFVRLSDLVLHRIPNTVSLREAALCEPLAVAVHAAYEDGRIRAGESVVVLGAGPIGLLCAAVARACGASPVIVAGMSRDEKHRLPAARAMGADATVNVETDDVVARVNELTGGRGSEVTIEAAGTATAVRDAIRVTRRLGRVVGVSVMNRPEILLPWNEALLRGLTITFTFSSTYSAWEKALELLGSRRIDVTPMITADVPLDRWLEAFRALDEGRATKLLLTP